MKIASPGMTAIYQSPGLLVGGMASRGREMDKITKERLKLNVGKLCYNGTHKVHNLQSMYSVLF